MLSSRLCATLKWNQDPDFAKRCYRQKEEARLAEEAAKRAREAEGERARRAAYSEALRREADRISAILAKQVRCTLFQVASRHHWQVFGKLF